MCMCAYSDILTMDEQIVICLSLFRSLRIEVVFAVPSSSYLDVKE